MEPLDQLKGPETTIIPLVEQSLKAVLKLPQSL